MATNTITDPSNFQGVISIVDRIFRSKKSSNPKIDFSKILGDVYSQHKHLKAFSVFKSVNDFKTKVLKYYNQRKSIRKRNKQKIPPGVRSWAKFWEEW